MAGLSPKQQEIFDYIEATIGERGTAPTVREIAAAMGLKSVATVHRHLQKMEEKGVIRRDLSLKKGVYTIQNTQEV